MINGPCCLSDQWPVLFQLLLDYAVSVIVGLGCFSYCWTVLFE